MEPVAGLEPAPAVYETAAQPLSHTGEGRCTLGQDVRQPKKCQVAKMHRQVQSLVSGVPSGLQELQRLSVQMVQNATEES